MGALALSAPAAASAAPCTANQAAQQGGSATLVLGKHLRITTIAPATGKGTATLPVGAGCLVPETGAGLLGLGGGVQFKVRHRQARLTALTLDTVSKTLIGRTRGRTLTLATLSGGAVARAGFNTTLVGMQAKLTATAAKLLRRGLPISGLHKGTPLGTLTVRPVATQALIKSGTGRLVLIKSGTGRLVLSSATAGALLSQAIFPAAVAPAALDFPTLTVTLPIVGGTFAVHGLLGSLNLAGGLKLTKGARTVTVSRLTATTSPPVATAHLDTLGAQVVSFANLNLSAIGLRLLRIRDRAHDVVDRLTAPVGA